MVNKFFDKIFLINLDRRKDRMDECEETFSENGIEYERFPGFDGLKITENYSRIVKCEIGCRMSHLNVLKQAKEEGLNSVLILEDDFELCENFFELLDTNMEQLPEDWQWLYFGGSHYEEPTKVTDNIWKVNKTYTTHAYAAKSEIFDKLIETLEVFDPADVRMAALQKELKTYVTIPHLIYQRDGFSDIQNTDVTYNPIRDSTLNAKKWKKK